MRGDQPTACSSTSENHPTTKQRQSLSPLDDDDDVGVVDVGVGDLLSCISVWKLTQHWFDGDDGNN